MSNNLLPAASVFLMCTASSVFATERIGTDYAAPTVDAATQVRAAAGIVARVTPAWSNRFVLELIPKDNGCDVFEIAAQGSNVILRGSTGGTIGTALGWYLRHLCNCEISWCGDQLALPAQLPVPTAPVRIVCPHKHRVYFNYCTLCYTGAWWDWERWQREIDFMALQGINMPLTVAGLEGVWYNTLREFGFSDDEARAYLVGPAYFAWQWMSNIQSHGGPLPKSWIESHVALGQQIIQRERELGMTPIQQAFYGYVPRELKAKFPQSSIAHQGEWCSFEGSAQLDPLDPLFPNMGAAFLKECIRLFGASHFYAGDPFHEGAPPKPGDQYLHDVGGAVYGVMTNVDPEATWVMQAWSIREKIACAVPKGRLLVLDLGGGAGGKAPFWGYDFVSGVLHNFGGRVCLHGDLAHLASNPFIQKREAPNSAGMGLFMEGTTQNPVYYNLALDMAWRTNAVDVRDWLHKYARRRYGAQSASANAAWDILLDTAYRPGTSDTEPSSIVAARPALQVKKSGPNSGFSIPYDQTNLVEAWSLLLKDAGALGASDAYKFDVVDVARQVMSNLGQELHKDAAAAFLKRDRGAFTNATVKFITLLRDIDTLLASRSEYHFGKWIADARRWGTTDAEKALFEKNAAMLVTIWGPESNPSIFEYSWREWAGLTKEFYLVRWQKFYAHLDECLAKGVEYKEDGLPQAYGREAFRANAFYSSLADWEIAWVNSAHNLPAKPQGDAVALSKAMLAKYAPVIRHAYSAERREQIRNDEIARMKTEYGEAAGEWSPQTVSVQPGVLTFDLTPYIKNEGTCEVRFQYTKGTHRLEIAWAALCQNDAELQRDTHHGRTGNEHVNNIYRFKLDALAFNTKYTLKAQVNSDGGNDSYGLVMVRKK